MSGPGRLHAGPIVGVICEFDKTVLQSVKRRKVAKDRNVSVEGRTRH
jgi:hypothetical protein